MIARLSQTKRTGAGTFIRKIDIKISMHFIQNRHCFFYCLFSCFAHFRYSFSATHMCQGFPLELSARFFIIFWEYPALVVSLNTDQNGHS